MKIVLLSDTHGLHYQVKNIPDGDVLIHAGDTCNRGSEQDAVNFLTWYNELPHKHKLFIAGNHDWFFQRAPLDSVRELLTYYPNVTYLFDEELIIDNVKFYGTPWQPEFCNWAFNVKRGQLYKHWKKIPDDVNILITHGPPMGILDEVKNWRSPSGENVGCDELLARIDQLKEIKLNVFGHIHEGYGEKEIKGVTYVNASVVNEHYYVVNDIKTFEI